MNYSIHHARISDTTLAYIKEGEGHPLLFIHGSLGDFRNWRRQIEAMSGKYRCIAMSRRLHWPNEYDDGGKDYTAENQGQDIAEFIHALGIEGCYVAAASYGGFSTLHACVKEPDLVGALVLGEPPILPWLHDIPGGQEHYDRFMRDAWAPATAAFEQDDLEGGVRNFLRGVTGRDAFAAAPEPVRQALMDNALEMKAEALSSDIFPVFSCEEVSHIQAPVLLLTGQYSPAFFSLITDKLERCLPDTRRALVPKASHSLQTGNPDFYNTVVMDFFASIGGQYHRAAES